MSGGGIFPVSGKVKRKMGSSNGISTSPLHTREGGIVGGWQHWESGKEQADRCRASTHASIILSSSACRDLACLTRLAYVPQEAINALMCAISSCCFLYRVIVLRSCSARVCSGMEWER